MRRWIDRWNAYWFPRTTTLPLSVSRIIAVAAQLLWFFPSLHEHVNLLEKNSEFIEPQLLIRGISAIVPREVFFTPSVFTALYCITALAGIAALVGLFTRTSVFVFALGTWIFIAHLYSYGDRHHNEALFAIFLMSLAFAPSGESLSLDALIRRRRGRSAAGTTAGPERTETAMWPLNLAHVLLAMTYFSTGATKLLSGGLAWMNGYTLQGYTFGDAINREIPLGIWLAQQHTLAIVLSVFTILFETFFFLSLVLPWTAPFFFLGGILFHTGLYLTAGHDFYQHIVMNFMLLLTITPDWWRDRLNRALDPFLSRWRTLAESP